MPIKAIIRTLFILTLVVLCGYGYCVNTAVLNAAEREKSEAAIGDIRSAIADLESRSFALRQEITPEYASAQGFVEVPTRFVKVGPSGLSFNR